MPELFDVVDENDVPTGKLVTKQQAHANGDLHRLIAIYVFDADGRLYLQTHHTGYLDHSVGGHVDAGETYLEAALREAKEELSLIDEQLDELLTSWYSDEAFCASDDITPQEHLFTVYECRPNASWKFIPNQEVTGIRAENLETIIRQIHETPGKFTPGIINTMAKFIEIKGLPYQYDLPKIRAAWVESARSLR